MRYKSNSKRRDDILEWHDRPVVTIPPHAYQTAAKVVEVALRGCGTVNIGRHAFERSASLKKLTIECDAAHIGERAFQGCTNLRTLALQCEDACLGAGAFSNTGIFTARLPAHVTTVGPGLFCDCPKLEYLMVPSNDATLAVMEAGGVLHGCTNFVAAVLPHHVIDSTGVWLHDVWLKTFRDSNHRVDNITREIHAMVDYVFDHYDLDTIPFAKLKTFWKNIAVWTKWDTGRKPTLVPCIFDLDFCDSDDEPSTNDDDTALVNDDDTVLVNDDAPLANDDEDAIGDATEDAIGDATEDAIGDGIGDAIEDKNMTCDKGTMHGSVFSQESRGLPFDPWCDAKVSSSDSSQNDDESLDLLRSDEGLDLLRSDEAEC